MKVRFYAFFRSFLTLFILSLFKITYLFAGYGDFLQTDDVNVVVEEGKAKVFPGGHDEKYWATDSKGNRYKLRLKDPLPNYAEIGASLLIDLIGAPNQAVHPILLKRGVHSLPTSENAKSLSGRGDKMGLAGSRGEWFAGTIQKVADLKRFDAAELTEKQLAELCAHLIVNHVMGNNDNHLGNGRSGNLGFDGTHFYTLDATQSFRFYPTESNSSAESSFHQAHYIFEQAFKRLSPAQVEDFTKNLNDYLTRLEKVSQSDLEPVLGHYFAGSNSLRKFKNQPEFNYWSELIRRLAEARHGTLSFLTKMGIDPSITEKLRTPNDTAKISVPVPHSSLRGNTIPSTQEQSELELVWAFYFQDFWKKRNEAISKWSKELDVPESEVIPTLIQRLSHQSHLAHQSHLEHPISKSEMEGILESAKGMDRTSKQDEMCK